MIPVEWLEQAVMRIAPYIERTPLVNDSQRNIYIKWENHQITGSFKARGALNKVLALEPWERQRGLVTASAGNHGQGVALAGKITQAPVIVFVYEHAVPVKIKAMRNLGAEVRMVPGGYIDAERAAMQYAAANKCIWISPYNDGQVIAGQGTLALEVLLELPEAGQMNWLVPVGGGGLIAGIGVALKERFPQACLIGVQSEASAFMHSIFYKGTQENVPDLPTLADGLAGGVEPDSVTIPMVQQLVDSIILVSEQEVAQTIAFAWKNYGEKIEGSGAVSLAAILTGRVKTPAIVVITGGNVQPGLFSRICKQYGGNHVH